MRFLCPSRYVVMRGQNPRIEEKTVTVNNALYEVFVHTIQDIYNSEGQITAALPKMIDAAHDEDLREALSDHLTQTHEHVSRVQQVCQMLGIEPGNVTCQG